MLIDQIIRSNLLVQYPKELIRLIQGFKQICQNVADFSRDLDLVQRESYHAMSPLQFLDRINFDISEFYAMNDILRQKKIFRKIKRVVIHLEEQENFKTSRWSTCFNRRELEQERISKEYQILKKNTKKGPKTDANSLQIKKSFSKLIR